MTSLWFVICSVTSLAYGSSVFAADLLPEIGLTNPKLRFQTGKVVDNKPEVSSTLPPIDGPASAWRVGQWAKSEYLSADNMYSPKLDYYAWETRNGESRVTVEKEGNRWVYSLFSKDGALKLGGGSNVFLSADLVRPTAMDQDMNLALDARIKEAVVTYDNALAKNNGAVLAQVFAGLWMQFRSPTTGKKISLALQIEIANSQNKRADHRGCRVTRSGMPRIVYGRSLPGASRFDFFKLYPSREPMRFNVNQYLCDLLSRQVSCLNNNEKQNLVWDNEARDLRNWTVRNFYIGVETQNKDARNKQSGAAATQGHASVALELANLQLTSSKVSHLSCSTL
jgi:hypothetical protein